MRARIGSWKIGLVTPLLAAAAIAQDAPPQDVVVVGVRPPRDVVVHAPPRCARRPGDPADLVPVHKGITEQRVIAPNRHGVLVWRSDDEPIGGDRWERAGTAVGDYVFRVPANDDPLCIGAAVRTPGGYGQLRRIVSADGMDGQYLHFSALVATRVAGLVRFWLTAVDRGNRRMIGGDTHADPLRGTRGWSEVDLLIGPVPHYADHVSYGLLLNGGGAVWMLSPKLEVLTLAQARAVAATPVNPLNGS